MNDFEKLVESLEALPETWDSILHDADEIDDDLWWHYCQDIEWLPRVTREAAEKSDDKELIKRANAALARWSAHPRRP